MPGNLQHSVSIATTPLFKHIFVEQHNVARDLRFARKLFVFVAAHTGDLRDERHC